MNELKTKRNWEADAWTSELQRKFQQIKDLFTDPAGGCCAHPKALGEPGAGEYILITDYSKDAICVFLHLGELLALDYGLKKFSTFLIQDRSDNYCYSRSIVQVDQYTPSSRVRVQV